MRFRSDPPPGNEATWLLRPESDNWNEGEIDFPDGGLDGTMWDRLRCAGCRPHPTAADGSRGGRRRLIGWVAIYTWTRPTPPEDRVRPGSRGYEMIRHWQWIVDDRSGGVAVLTSRRQATTSTVVVADGRALVVDPAWDPDELAGLAADLAAAEIEVVIGFATHAHHDHLLWHPDLGPARRLAAPAVARSCARHRDRIVARLGPHWPADLGDLVGRVTGTAGQVLDWPGPTVRLLTHDAHSPGHTALWLPARRALIAGDMLSDVELPLLEESTSAAYAAGLELLRPFVAQASVLIPGHGGVALGADAAQARWWADRAYLDALLAGADPADPRLANPGMAHAHADNLAAAGR
ncbi:MAG TPA: MBL fold metallo-hydrolase [Nakamurella sp.]